MERDSYSDEEIKEIFSLKNVAVIGMSKNQEKAANYVPKYLAQNGFNIIPVNPTADEILNKKCYHSIEDVKEPIDIVDVFRPSEQVLPVVQEAIKMKHKVIWLQEGIHNAKAEDLARKEGIKVVFNRCMLAEHQRLFKQMAEKTFSDFYQSLLDLVKSFEKKKIMLKIK